MPFAETPRQLTVVVATEHNDLRALQRVPDIDVDWIYAGGTEIVERCTADAGGSWNNNRRRRVQSS